MHGCSIVFDAQQNKFCYAGETVWQESDCTCRRASQTIRTICAQGAQGLGSSACVIALSICHGSCSNIHRNSYVDVQFIDAAQTVHQVTGDLQSYVLTHSLLQPLGFEHIHL